MNRAKAYRGIAFQNLILAVASRDGGEYWRRRVAFLEQNEVATGFDKRRRTIFYKAKKGFDFFGVHWVRTGNGHERRPVPLYVEAKDIQGEKLKLVAAWEHKNTPGIKDHQINALVTLEHLHCECYILWRSSPTTVWRLRPQALLAYYKPSEWIRAGDERVMKEVLQVGHWLDFLEEL
jgi:hypothetical protein